MGLGMNRFWFSVVEFAGLSVRGVRVSILNPDGSDATIYADERQKAILPNPIVLNSDGLVAFYISLGSVDVVIRDPVRGGCVVRNITPLIHRVTFEPDSAGSKLLGSFASWSGNPFVVDCVSDDQKPAHEPIMIDIRQALVGDVIRVKGIIAIDVEGVSQSHGPTLKLSLSPDDTFNTFQNVTCVGNLYDDGLHHVHADVDLIVIRTGVDGLIQSSACFTNIVKAGSDDYIQRVQVTTVAGPDTGEGRDISNTQAMQWYARGSSQLTKCNVWVPVTTVELIRK